MEAVLMHGSLDRSISPYRSPLRNPRKIQYNCYPFLSLPSENYLPSHFQTAGVLQAPPPFLSHSYPPYSSQPPLLPLPAVPPLRRALSRGSSSPLTSKKPNNGCRNKESSLTPKKLSKSQAKNPKMEGKNSPEKFSENATVSSTNLCSKESPKSVPNAPRVLPLKSSASIYTNADNCISNANGFGFAPKEMGCDRVDMFSGSVAFTISPPPSSLPLPTFSLRPKLSCSAEAAGIDTGATDDLRRLLRL